MQETKVTTYALFITVYALKNIKNGSHGTIHIFKNYFATVLSVFSFKFLISITINSIQTDLSILNSYNTHHFKNLSLPQVKKIIRKVATFRSSRFKRDIYLKSPT